MRNFTIAIAAVSMLGMAAAHAAQPSVKGHQPGAEPHHQPTAHRILAEGEQLGTYRAPRQLAEGEQLGTYRAPRQQVAEGEQLGADRTRRAV